MHILMKSHARTASCTSAHNELGTPFLRDTQQWRPNLVNGFQRSLGLLGRGKVGSSPGFAPKYTSKVHFQSTRWRKKRIKRGTPSKAPSLLNIPGTIDFSGVLSWQQLLSYNLARTRSSEQESGPLKCFLRKQKNLRRTK